MTNSNHRWILLGLIGLCLLAAGSWWFQRGYGETSELGYQYAVALFSACNQQDTAKLEKLEAMVGESAEAGELHDAEARWLEGIIRQGQAGRWTAASRQVRRLMEDQLRSSPPPAD